MSSNIKVQRICQHCGSEFTALTTTTAYCSKQCNSRAYKAKLRAKKVEISNEATQQIKTKPIEILKNKEFLSVKEVSKLLGCSIRTIYYQIENGNLNAYNISQRVTRIRRTDIDKLFEQPQPVKNVDKIPIYNIEDCYTVTEIIQKFKISDSALNNIAKKNNIPKLKKGKFTYLPKIIIDELLN
ncbi:MAG: helix-turn-helix domain-containing protein [Chitinophagales bacterium]|jgi:excisionase family DNA binding protein|nr:helix-turn-helix domain-containing protein [Chitinophagales bacterium]